MTYYRCKVCGKEIEDGKEPYFISGGYVYCEKCYANKRWSELKAENKHIKWYKTMIAIAKRIAEIEDKELKKQLAKRFIQKIPDEVVDKIKEIIGE